MQKILLLCLFLIPFNSWGRLFLDKSLFHFVVLNEESDYKVTSDGIYTLDQVLEFAINNEGGVAYFSLYKIPYRSHSHSIQVLEAKTITEGKEYPIGKDKIHDTSISAQNGLSDLRELQLVFPNLKLGSKIYIKYRMSTNKIVVANHFSTFHKLGEFGQADRSVLRFTSDLPLYKHVNPWQLFDVQEKKLGAKYFLEIKLKQPTMLTIASENGEFPKSLLPSILVSTHKDWTHIGNRFQRRFDKVLDEQIPPALLPVIAEAKKIKATEGKVHFLQSYIIKNFNYVGDWRTLAGQFSPKNLNELLKSKNGDCKDFATLLTVLLRASGLEAHIGLVSRGGYVERQYQPLELPNNLLFNHAIVRLSDKGKTYWLDPTNDFSFGLFHRDDLAGRMALALDKSYELEEIPHFSGEKSSFKVHKIINFEAMDRGKVEASIQATGLTALDLFQLFSRLEPEALKQTIAAIVQQGEQQILVEHKPVSFSDRQYRKMDLKVSYSASDLSKDQGGIRSFNLPSMAQQLSALMVDTTEWVGSLYLGEPSSFERVTEYRNIFAKTQPASCQIDNEWVSLSRKYFFEKEGIKLAENLIIKKRFVPSTKFNSTEFKLLQSEASRCLRLEPVLFTFGEKKHSSAENEISAKFAKLPPKERREQRYKFVYGVLNGNEPSPLKGRALIPLLESNIKEDPQHYPSYELASDIVLRDGYLNGENYNHANIIEAIDYIKKGLEKNPKAGSLYLYSSRLEMLRQDLRKSQEFLDKAISLGGLDKTRYQVRLARAYSTLKDKVRSKDALKNALKYATENVEKAVAHFEMANFANEEGDFEGCVTNYKEVFKYDPKDAFSHINIVSCLLRLRKYEEAVSIAERGRSITNAGMMLTWSAYAHYDRGVWHFKEKRLAQAEKDFVESLHFSKLTEALHMLARIKIDLKKYDEAVAIIAEGASSPKVHKASYFKSFVDQKLGPAEFRIKLADVALKEEPRDPGAMYMNLFILLSKGEALVELKKKSDAKEVLVKINTLLTHYAKSNPQHSNLQNEKSIIKRFEEQVMKL